jgi:hypothetical protein
MTGDVVNERSERDLLEGMKVPTNYPRQLGLINNKPSYNSSKTNSSKPNSLLKAIKNLTKIKALSNSHIDASLQTERVNSKP